jgi:ubiquinone biosynthesis protein UbiJ
MSSSIPFPPPFPPPGLLAAPIINHLLAQEAWARDALALHTGKLACIDFGTAQLRLQVQPGGMVQAGDAEAAADVTIRVKLADLPLIAQNRERAFSYVKIEGDAEFANAISQLSQGLRWEAEADLEPWLGTIAATRLVSSARSAVETAQTTHQKVLENVAEFLLEEQPLLVRPSTVEDFSSDVSRLRDDVERAAKRLQKLEQALARRQAAAPDAAGTGPAAAEATHAAGGAQRHLDL